MKTHAQIVASYPDHLLEAIRNDLGKRNLRDYKDHETRFCAERVKAARSEIRRRKGLDK